MIKTRSDYYTTRNTWNMSGALVDRFKYLEQNWSLWINIYNLAAVVVLFPIVALLPLSHTHSPPPSLPFVFVFSPSLPFYYIGLITCAAYFFSKFKYFSHGVFTSVCVYLYFVAHLSCIMPRTLHVTETELLIVANKKAYTQKQWWKT